MKFNVTTYKTITGKKRYLETIEKDNYQWIIYSGNRPKYFIDVFDFKTESNIILNSLLISSKKTINEIIEALNRKFNLNLSVPKAPSLSFKVKSEIKQFNLEPIPEEWLSYSL